MQPTRKQKAKQNAEKARAAARRKADKLKESRAGSKLSGFSDFVRKQGVVGLAIGLAIGTQASELVRNMVGSVITPLVDLLVGNDGLAGLTWTVHLGGRTGVFDFGMLIDSTIKFLAVAVVIYVVVLGLKLDKLDKKKD